VAKPLWWILVAMMALFLVLLLARAPGNMIVGVLMIGCVVLIATVIAAGLESPT
jgi:hypothetical protein